MGYYDRFLMHEDKRDKGMNSTSNEKGTDGKKNNTSEYNHDYYMKNKEKWQDNKGVAKYGEYEDGDPDFDDKNFDEKNRLGDTDFFGFQKPDGSWVILEEDMKWTVPAGMSKEDMTKALESFSKRVEDGSLSFKEWQKAATEAINSASKKTSGEKEFDVDAAAKDVIRGKYGNGAERRAALGEDYAAVQRIVDEMMKGDSAKHSEEDEEMDELYHHGIKGQHWGVRRFENKNGTLTAAGRKRYNTDEDGNYKKLSRSAIRKAGRSEYSKVYDKLYEKHDNPDWVHEKAKAAQEKLESQLKSDNKEIKTASRFGKKIAKSNAAQEKMLAKRAENREKIKALGDYQKKYESTMKAQNANDEAYKNVQDLRKKLGKTALGRTINSAKNKSEEAKAYNKAYNDWSKKQDKIDKQWDDVKASYQKTGKNKAERVLNNIMNGKDVKASLRDFDSGTKLVKAGYEQHKNTLERYGSMKISAMSDKSVKKTSEYKEAKKAYKKQERSDRRYGTETTVLKYIADSKKKG